MGRNRCLHPSQATPRIVCASRGNGSMQQVAQLAGKRSFTITTDRRHVPVSDSWEKLIDRVEAVPEGAQVRGMFLREVTRMSLDGGKSGSRYVPFSMYPVREYMQLMINTAK